MESNTQTKGKKREKNSLKVFYFFSLDLSSLCTWVIEQLAYLVLEGQNLLINIFTFVITTGYYLETSSFEVDVDKKYFLHFENILVFMGRKSLSMSFGITWVLRKAPQAVIKMCQVKQWKM